MPPADAPPTSAVAGSRSRSRATNAFAASDSPSWSGTTVTSARRPSREATGAATSAASGSARAMRAATAAWSRATTTTWIGAPAPGPVTHAAASKPWRVSLPGGNWRSAPLSECSARAGAARASSTVAAAAQRAGDRHRDRAEAERERRGGERPEDGEQDQRDDR
jgi:hypothetical protein